MATAERWQQVRDLFHAAIEREPRDRSSFLVEACSGNESLRQEIESLISAHEEESHFIDSPAYEAAAEMLTESREFVAGQMIGHYEIVSVLGKGGMGEVYLATDTKLKRKVGLKVLSANNSGAMQAQKRLVREAQAAAALDHPNICAIYEVGTDGGVEYIAMQYVEGETLDARMSEHRLSLDEALNVGSQMADALIEAHARSLVHRDIKPSNIMLDSRGQVKVLDFGLAKTTLEGMTRTSEEETKTLLSSPGMILGTVPYMSPEQVRGERVDARTDIFSFGAVLYEMLSGQRAFGRDSAAETIGAILHTQPPDLTSIDSNIPKALEQIVSKCLAKDREQRYQNMRDVANDLSAVRSGELATVKVQPARITQPTELPADSLRSYLRPGLLALSVLVLIALGLGLYRWFKPATIMATPIDSLAVLPFANASNDQNMEYLSDGITENLIDNLSQLPKLKVKSRDAVFRYKGKEADAQKVGQELGVRAVLKGDVRQVGDELVINAELVATSDDSRIWGQRYTRKASEIIAMQNDIAREIASNLRLKLSDPEKEQVDKRSTQNVEAYQLYLQGRYYLRKNTNEARIKSGEYFQKAIEKDPNYALGYAGLADSYAALANFGQMPPKEAWRKAEEAAVKALAIDDALGEAHYSLGLVKVFYDWDWPGAETEFKRAIELNPEAEAYVSYPYLLEATGRFDEAIAVAKHSYEVDPLSEHHKGESLGHFLYEARRYDQAIEEWRKTIERDPASFQAHLGLGEIYVKQKRYEEALAEMLKARPLVSLPRQLARIGYVYAAAGKRDEAIKILDEVKGLTSERYNLGTHIAAIYAALGNKDQAFAWLEKASEEHEYGVIDLKVDPRFDTLRSDPRFTDLLARLHLAP